MFKYYITKTPFASGPHSSVHQASHRSTGAQLCIKKINKKAKYAQSEVDLIKQISRKRFKNVVNVLDTFSNDKWHFIVMPLYPYNLGQVIRIIGGFDAMNPSLSVPAFYYVFGTLANTMYHLHQMNILHRDFKPDNVLITKSGKPQLSDFGLSKKSQVTTSVVGTAWYKAPEIQYPQSYGYNQSIDTFSFARTVIDFLDPDAALKLNILYKQDPKKYYLSLNNLRLNRDGTLNINNNTIIGKNVLSSMPPQIIQDIFDKLKLISSKRTSFEYCYTKIFGMIEMNVGQKQIAKNAWRKLLKQNAKSGGSTSNRYEKEVKNDKFDIKKEVNNDANNDIDKKIAQYVQCKYGHIRSDEMKFDEAISDKNLNRVISETVANDKSGIKLCIWNVIKKKFISWGFNDNSTLDNKIWDNIKPSKRKQ